MTIPKMIGNVFSNIGSYLSSFGTESPERLMQEQKRAIRTIVLIAPKDNPADYETLSAHS